MIIRSTVAAVAWNRTISDRIRPLCPAAMLACCSIGSVRSLRSWEHSGRPRYHSGCSGHSWRSLFKQSHSDGDQLLIALGGIEHLRLHSRYSATVHTLCSQHLLTQFAVWFPWRTLGGKSLLQGHLSYMADVSTWGRRSVWNSRCGSNWTVCRPAFCSRPCSRPGGPIMCLIWLQMIMDIDTQ